MRPLLTSAPHVPQVLTLRICCCGYDATQLPGQDVAAHGFCGTTIGAHGVETGALLSSGQVLRAAMEGVEADAQMYPQTVHVDLGVAAMGVVTPEGQLIRTGARLRHSPSTPALEGQSALLPLSTTGCCATPACSHTQGVHAVVHGASAA